MPFIMNNERYNPHLSSYIRNNKPPYEGKENLFRSVYARDNRNARLHSENNRTRFAELKAMRIDKKKESLIINKIHIKTGNK